MRHDTRDPALRPKLLKDIIGLDNTKRRLEISIMAAQERGDPLMHTLIESSPGTGKTSLCHAIANEMKAKLIEINAANIKVPQDLFSVFKDMNPFDVLMLDECHNLPRKVEDSLLTCMEDFVLNMPMGSPREKVWIQHKIKPFTLLGATTRPGKLDIAFKSRFRNREQLDPYTDEQITQIITINADKLGVKIEDDAAKLLAQKSRRNPRLSLDRLFWVRDYYQHKSGDIITPVLVEEAMKEQGIDDYGLTKNDRRYLMIMFYNHNCGPIGLKSLSNSLLISDETIEVEMEPWMMEQKLLKRGSTGRYLTEPGAEYAQKLCDQIKRP